MSSLEELLSQVNSGAVNVNKSDAAKRQQRKPKAQTDLQKKLRGQAGVVNNASGAAAKTSAAEKRSAAASTRATPPPQHGGGAAGGSGTPGPGPSVGATAPGPGLGPSVGGTLPPAAPAVPPPLAADAPVPMRLKRVLDLLRSNRDTFTFADLKAKLNMDLNQDTELLEHLQSHTQVTYDGVDRTLRYRPKVQGINNSTDLLNYLRRHTTVEGASAAVPMTGVRLGDIADAYLTIADDIKRLQAEGAIYVLGHTSAGSETLFAVQSMGMAPASEAVFEMFHNTRLPVDMIDMQWRCKDLGLKSALASRPVRIKDENKDKKKKRKRSERRFNVEKATNAHMRELFEGAQPTNIDTK
ncbi:hypothetical protein HYH02_002800 [Chlamydomonas schloesseri]|uniref:TFIIE beta domain-containing protein n=1 Tax=Chlamydomonas schloesseri TaxID=2026947 RepID=A0A835WR46_9CHLO|nr:hypothetical protein HYH02_002800 [Chlamydomonas schloesseri]|eukprot:KAG2452563.1 hypothetical protein HYH02_002800 [Chlamydomonas schloesseri]